jgi:hypothetical protein
MLMHNQEKITLLRFFDPKACRLAIKLSLDNIFFENKSDS